MKIIVLLFLLLQLGFSYETNYAKLAKSKADFKKLQHLKRASSKNKKDTLYKDYIEIIHKDITKNTTEIFTKRYELKLYKCVAKNICIYIYKGNNSLDVVIKKIKDAKEDIKAVYKYERRNIIAF